MTYPIIETSSTKMNKVMDHLQNELNQVRTGMANVKLVDHLEVSYYGAKTPLNQVAGISVAEGRIIVIKPYDPSLLKEIEHVCNEANLDMSPANDGSVIRLTVPQLTGETRKEMSKKVAKLAEEAKVQIRNIRREAMNVVKKDKDVAEDMQKDMETEIQKLTDKYIKDIETQAKAKEAEVLKV